MLYVLKFVMCDVAVCGVRMHSVWVSYPSFGLHNIGDLKYECAVSVDFVWRCGCVGMKGWVVAPVDLWKPESEVFLTRF